MAIPYAFLPRWAAGWAAVSVHLRLDGLVRNLTTVGDAGSDLPDSGADIGERVSNVVVMGTGEPLDNYDNLIKFIRTAER